MRFHSGRLAALGLTALLAAGCYEAAWFYPARGQGPHVTDGRVLGVASRLVTKAGEAGEEGGGQCYVVVSVGQVYTADQEESHEEGDQRGGRKTIVQVLASVVNETDAPVRFETQEVRLEVAGRVFSPKWSDREPAAEGEAVDTVGPGVVVRYELYFDLGAYAPAGRFADPYAPPVAGGIPLRTIRELTVTWKASSAGEEKSGRARFVRDRPGAWPMVAGPYWGGGWYTWANPWSVGPMAPGILIWPRRMRPGIIK